MEAVTQDQTKKDGHMTIDRTRKGTREPSLTPQTHRTQLGKFITTLFSYEFCKKYMNCLKFGNCKKQSYRN